MISVRELRLRNWVYGYDDKKPWQVTWLEDDGTEIDPIPLTPEILEKAGLVKHGAIWIHPETMLLEIYNRAKLDGNYHFIGGRMQPDYFLATTKQLRFVHELQNAYALTGTELEINLK